MLGLSVHEIWRAVSLREYSGGVIPAVLIRRGGL